jgi:hemolysin activation/secretion protein
VKMNSVKVLVLQAGTLLLATKGFAHTTTHVAPPSTNAGVLDRTIEREYEAQPMPPNREVPLLEVDIPDEQLNFGEHRAVFIERIEIEGNKCIKTKGLRSILRCYEGRELSMQDIRELTMKIRAHYVKQGYFLARAYPPVQHIKDCTLKIEVLEGTLGRILICGNKYYSDKFISSYFMKYVGQPLNYDDFLRSLMLVNENTDLSVGAVFEKGLCPGTADVILRVEDKRPIHLYFNTNDYGSHFTTAQRSGLRLDYGNALMQGATLSVAEVVGSPFNSLTFTDARYSFPITSSGWSGIFSYMYTHFRVKHVHFSGLGALHIKGISEIAGAKVNYALYRSRKLTMDVYGSFQYKQIKDIALGETTSEDKLRVFAIGTDLGFGDFLNGNNFLNFTFHQGVPNFLAGNDAVSSHGSRHGAGARYSIFNLDYKRMQQLFKDFFLITNFSGQYSQNKLPVPEQFYIGGMDTIRGYPLAVALGDSGYFANVEFRIPPPFKNARLFGCKNRRLKEMLQFVAFCDFGGVDLHTKEAPLPKGWVGLVSAGAGVRIYGPWHFDVSVDWGHPLNDRDRGHSDSIWYWKVNWGI